MSSLEERKQLLFDDPDISKVEPHRVYCNRCNKWLKLDEVKLYAASVWRCHKNTKSHNSRPQNPSATPSRTSEEDQLSSSSNQKSASDLLSTSLPSREGRRNLRKFARSRGSVGDTPRFRNSDTASVSSSSSTTRAMSRLKVTAANVISDNALNNGNGGTNTQTEFSLGEQEAKGLSLPSNSSSTKIPEAPQPIAGPSNTTNQTLEQTSAMSLFKPPPVSRILSISNKDVLAVRLQVSSPEQMLPQRKASYRALIAEPYIGKLEPYRAFCTLCSVWVSLSSRTPYSYGVWKGHVRKSDKHKILQTSNADDEYNTGSDHSQEEGIATTSQGLSRPSEKILEETIIIIPPANKQFAEISKGEMTKAVTIQADATTEGSAVMPKSDPEFLLLRDTKTSSESATPGDMPSLQDTRFNETGPTQILIDKPKDTLIQDEAAFLKLTPQKQASLLALQHRRQTMLSDPSAAVVESRRVKCGICDHWIKGSNTQEYSLHHWLKHRKKCIRNKKDLAVVQQSGFLDERRRDLLEKDPDIKEVEPHRAFCNQCEKWVKLGNRSRYSVNHWLRHKKNCPAAIDKNTEHVSGTPAVEEDDVTRLNDAVSANAEMRRLALQMDHGILELSENCITCRQCLAVISLSQSTPFMPEAWVAHKASCYSENVTDEVQRENETKSRERILRADPSISVVDSCRIRCKSCDLWVDFNATVPYSLTDWEVHRKECSSNQRARLWSKSSNDGMEVDAEAHVEKSSTHKDAQAKCDSIVTVTAQDREIQAESTILMNANARHKFLLYQPDILRVEAHRVMCGRCLSWIDSEDQQTICATEKWLRHKDGCPGVLVETLQNPDEQRSKSTFRSRISTNMRSFRGISKGKGKGMAVRRAPSPMTLPPLPPRPRWPGEDERKQQFIEDPDVARIEPHRLLCKNCNCWIRLHPIIRYSLGIWPKHKETCRSSQSTIPGDARMRAKSEKEDIRRQMLEEDPYVTEIGPHRVTCKACGTNIRLDTTYKYEGSHWRAHRARCPQIPFADRSMKKRKGDGRKLNLQHEGANSREQFAPDHSCDSDDSDASSAPRPQPTAFFTAPLEVNLMKMFKQESREADFTMETTVQDSPRRREAELLRHLHDLAMDLDASGRLNMVIESSGDGNASVGRRFGYEKSNDFETSDDFLGDDNHQTNGAQPVASNAESWVPRKRTREEEEEFNAIFKRWPKLPSPVPKGKQRVCKLSGEGVKVLE